MPVIFLAQDVIGRPGASSLTPRPLDDARALGSTREKTLGVGPGCSLILCGSRGCILKLVGRLGKHNSL